MIKASRDVARLNGKPGDKKGRYPKRKPRGTEQGKRKNWSSDPSLILVAKSKRPSKASLGHIGLNATAMRFRSEGMGKATRKPLTPYQEEARLRHSEKIEREFREAMRLAGKLR